MARASHPAAASSSPAARASLAARSNANPVTVTDFGTENVTSMNDTACRADRGRLRAQLRPNLGAGARVLLQQALVDLLRGPVLPMPGPERRRLAPRRGRARRGIARVEHVRVDRLHQIGVDLAGQPERLGAFAPPQPRRLAGGHGAGVVALPGLGHLVGQVADRVPAEHAQHDATKIITGAPSSGAKITNGS